MKKYTQICTKLVLVILEFIFYLVIAYKKEEKVEDQERERPCQKFETRRATQETD